MTISGFVAYVKQLWKNKPDASTPLSAERLLHMEAGIKGNSDAIEKLAAAVVNQIVNDPNKIAGMAALFALNQKVTELNGNLSVKSINLSLISNPDWSVVTALVLTYGKIAVVRIEATAKSANNEWSKIGNGFPDPHFNIYYESSNNTGQYKVKIETDGSLFLSNRSKTTGTSIDTMFVYVLK